MSGKVAKFLVNIKRYGVYGNKRCSVVKVPTKNTIKIRVQKCGQKCRQRNSPQILGLLHTRKRTSVRQVQPRRAAMRSHGGVRQRRNESGTVITSVLHIDCLFVASFSLRVFFWARRSPSSRRWPIRRNVLGLEASTMILTLSAQMDIITHFLKCLGTGLLISVIRQVRGLIFNLILSHYCLQNQACKYAWELLTETFMLSPHRLYVTYFNGDEKLGIPADTETKEIWKSLG